MLLLTEFSYSCIQFWKYEECEDCIKEAFDLSGIEIDLAGKLGRLTKWQSFDTAQLVLDIKSKDVELKTLQVAEKKEEEEKNALYVEHDEESILLEKPNFADNKAPDLSNIAAEEISTEVKLVM